MTDPTVLAIQDVDPGRTVALHLDRSNPGIGPDDDSNVVLFTVPGAELPQALCGYFDPRGIDSPFDCQVPISVGVAGRRYVLVETLDDPQALCGNDYFVFLPGELEPLTAVDDLDPRLLYFDPDPVAQAVRGVAPETLLVLSSAQGFGRTDCVLVAEGATEVPFELCPFVNWARTLGSQMPEDERLASLLTPAGCHEPVDAVLQERLATLVRNADEWSKRKVEAYEFTVEFECFCGPDLAGPFTVRVAHGGDVEDIRRGGESLATDDPARSWIGEVRSLFSYVGLYFRSSDLEVRYQADLAFPVELRADPSDAEVDDEFGFTITGFTILE